MIQIHVGGTQRSGKTTLANLLEGKMVGLGFKPVILDVDHTKLTIFGPNAPIGSPENAARQRSSYNALFGLRIPDVLAAGGVPIMTATHAQDTIYARARQVAARYGAEARFILIESVSVSEATRRANADTTSTSDMRDLDTNEQARKTFLETCARFDRIYRNPDQPFIHPHLYLKQGTPEEMAERAMHYILTGE